MVSRRKILSRSRDELNTIKDYVEDDEDVWFLKESLYKDHLQEVLQKWEQLDDEIWSKIICMERNRRIAKAYARAEELTINGSEDGFNGFRIGLNGFENPMRDAKTAEMKRYIGNGIRLKMDDNGNVLAKRTSRSNVYVLDVLETKKDEHSIGSDITKNNGEIAMNKALKLFDMKRFQNNIDKELRQAYPDRRKLEYQCITSIGFVGKGQGMLDSPIWVMIINVVALDMLKRKLPTAPKFNGDKKLYSRPRLPIPFEEDPYSIPGNVNNSSSSNGGIYSKLPVRDSKPPKLPPRDFNSRKKLMTVPEPDYEDSDDHITKSKKKSSPVKKISKIEDEDPYYCGMLARVPNYNKKKQASKPSSKQNYSNRGGAYDIYGYGPRQPPTYTSMMPYNMYASSVYRSVDSLIDSHRNEEIYSHIYGSRLRMPTAPTGMPFRSSRANAYVGNWE